MGGFTLNVKRISDFVSGFKIHYEHKVGTRWFVRGAVVLLGSEAQHTPQEVDLLDWVLIRWEQRQKGSGRSLTFSRNFLMASAGKCFLT